MHSSLSSNPVSMATSGSSMPLSPLSPLSSSVSSIMDDSSPATSPSVPLVMSPPGRNEGVGTVRGAPHRRVVHLSAEKRRRGNLRNGFDELRTLVPSVASNPRVSKACMLQKTAEHIRKLKAESLQMKGEKAILKNEIERTNEAINELQSQLPETGVPVTRQRVTHMNEQFEHFVRRRTMEDWKYWIFANIMRDVFHCYNSTVSTVNLEEMQRTIAIWLDQHCSLIKLRPMTTRVLKEVSVTTSILTDPGRIQEQATQAAVKAGHPYPACPTPDLDP